MNPIRFALILKNVRRVLGFGWFALLGSVFLFHTPFIALWAYFPVLAAVGIAEKMVLKKYSIPASMIGETNL